MKTLLKRIGLITLLVIPILFYFFLKSFGFNHYDLPYYGATGVTASGDTNYHQVSTPELVSLLDNHELAVVVSLPVEQEKQVAISNQLVRLKRLYQNKLIVPLVYLREGVYEVIPIPKSELVLLSNDSLMSDLFPSFTYETVCEIKSELFGSNTLPNFCKEETMVIEKEEVNLPDVTILLDKKGFIRGYYKSGDSKELNRLKEEISVLIQSYEHDRE
ncbi:MAG: hypothetical protein AB8B61_05590 [Cyclobacteriaceae bacterium]